tara:strand:+ start:9638 stop:11161 length:1524 start_codon:yes stop_codon:yes gene_type:complete
MLSRYTASADTTIVNAFQLNLRTRGTGANCGQADVMEAFSIYGRQQASSSTKQGSQELSRILIKFPVDKITTDRASGTVPASGSVSFYLKLFNAPHSKTVPRDYKLIVNPISQAWQEGVGLDLEGYKDLTKGNPGANWMSASDSAAWTKVGGDYLTADSSVTYEQTFESGLEDLEIDISKLVEQWVDGTTANNGVGVFLSSSYEAYYSGSAGADTGSILNNLSGAEKSYYTKRFFARGTQYHYKKPVIEARWDSSRKDDRGEFYFSSSLAPAADNLNTLYLYNFIRGRLVDIPSVGTSAILVSLYSGSATDSDPSGSKQTLYDENTNITGGHVSTGIYSCSIGIESSSINTLYDVWHSGGVEFSTGSISPMIFATRPTTKEPVYFINITNLANTYRSDETARMNLYVRHKNWDPTIYTRATADPETTSIQSASYRVIRTIDNLEVVSYGTGSDFHTGLSYDISGNYFDFDMNLLEPGYEYKYKFCFYDSRMNTWKEQRQEFRFRVEQ